MTHWPQITIAAGLLLNFVFCAGAWWSFRRRIPVNHIYRRSGWVIAMIPIIEAWVLHKGGFF